MQGLSGDFTTMPLKDVVQYLGNRRVSGKLLVQRGGVFKDVTLSEGSVVSASSNQPREYLGQFLINMGHLTEDQLSRAFEAQRETDFRLGKILVMQKIVPEETVLSMLSLKFREMLLDACQWADGEFQFEIVDISNPLEGLDV